MNLQFFTDIAEECIKFVRLLKKLGCSPRQCLDVHHVEVLVDFGERPVLVMAVVTARTSKTDPISVELSAFLRLVLRRNGRHDRGL